MKRLAIITARGGSKRIPRKNIKEFCGKPIIAYSIEAALNSGLFDVVMVSTDDEEIAEIAEKYGASVPFYRSAETSNDFATTGDVLHEVLNEYEKRGMTFDTHACIYPCAPFITPEKLREAFDILESTDADSVTPVVQFSYPPQRCFAIEDGRLVFQNPQYARSRSQDLEPLYHDIGQYYAYKTSIMRGLEKGTGKCYPVITPDEYVQDIDNESDWRLAEVKYKAFME